MMELVEAFGGLVGIGLIGVAVLAVILIGDWLMMKSFAKRGGKKDDGPPP